MRDATFFAAGLPADVRFRAGDRWPELRFFSCAVSAGVACSLAEALLAVVVLLVVELLLALLLPLVAGAAALLCVDVLLRAAACLVPADFFLPVAVRLADDLGVVAICLFSLRNSDGCFGITVAFKRAGERAASACQVLAGHGDTTALCVCRRSREHVKHSHQALLSRLLPDGTRCAAGVIRGRRRELGASELMELKELWSGSSADE